VYERQDEHVGEGHYRLRLVVGGDKLIQLTPFIQVPEAFSRRYEQMRSANDAIAAVDQIALFGLYLLGFCGIGLFFMIRQHWVLWRQPLLWGSFLALLLGLQQLNQWPLLWMGYDTAVPASGFAIRQFLAAAATFGAFAVLLTVSFMAAETLSRRAFLPSRSVLEGLVSSGFRLENDFLDKRSRDTCLWRLSSPMKSFSTSSRRESWAGGRHPTRS